MWYLIKNNQIEKIIFKKIALTLDNIQYPESIFSNWTEQELNNIGIYSVTIVKPPLTDDTKKYGDVQHDVNTLTATYPIIDKPQERIDAEQLKKTERQRVEDMNNQVLDSTQLQAFAKMTNSEFDTWWTDNVTDTASAIQTMKQLAEVIRPLIPIKPDEISDEI